MQSIEVTAREATVVQRPEFVLVRVVEPQPPKLCRYEMVGSHKRAVCIYDDDQLPGGVGFCPPLATSAEPYVYCPFGVPGEVVGFREEWIHWQDVCYLRRHSGYASYQYGDGSVGYKADGFDSIEDFKRHTKLMIGDACEAVIVRDDNFQPASTMPDWAIRSFGEVVEVTCKRFKDLTNIEELELTGMTPADFLINPWLWVGRFKQARKER